MLNRSMHYTYLLALLLLILGSLVLTSSLAVKSEENSIFFNNSTEEISPFDTPEPPEFIRNKILAATDDRENNRAEFNNASTTDFKFESFSDDLPLTLIESASVQKNVLQLTSATEWQLAATWYNGKVKVTDGFETEFQFQITDPACTPGFEPGADGFAFVIHSDPAGLDAIGTIGNAIGYGTEIRNEANPGIYNSIAIEFDTHNSYGFNDPNDNHISIQSKGQEANSADHIWSLGSTTNISNLSDGNIHRAKIRYAPGEFIIYLDNLNIPVLTVPLTIESKLSLNNDEAWIGFTSATGQCYERHAIYSWSFNSNATVPNGVQLLNNPSFEDTGNPHGAWQDNQQNSCFLWTYPTGDPAGDPSEGSRFLVAHRNGGTACTSFYQDVSRDPLQGETYTFAIDARAPANGVAREFDLVIWAIGGDCPEQHAQKRVVVTNNTWATHMIQLTIDNSCHQSLRAEVYLASDDRTQTVNYNFDNARLIGPKRTSLTGRVTRDLGNNQEIKVYTSINGQSIETHPNSNGDFTLELPAGQYVIAVDDQDRSVFVPGSVFVDTNNPPSLQFSGKNLNNFVEILENDSFESGPDQSWQWNGSCFRDSVALEQSAGGAFHDSKALVTHGGGGTNCISFYQDVHRFPQVNEHYIFEVSAKAPTNQPEHERYFEMQLFAISDGDQVQIGERKRFTVTQQTWTRHNVEITIDRNEYHTLRAEVYLMDNDRGQEIQYHFDHARLLTTALRYSVSGTIMKSNGSKLAGASVSTLVSGKPVSTESNVNGHYVFNNIPAGKYDIVVGMEDRVFAPRAISINVQQNVGKVDFTAPQLYNSKTSYFEVSKDGSPADGQSTNSVIFYMYDIDGEPILDRKLRFYSNNPMYNFMFETVNTNEEGKATAYIKTYSGSTGNIIVKDLKTDMAISGPLIYFIKVNAEPTEELRSAVNQLIDWTTQSLRNIDSDTVDLESDAEYFYIARQEDTIELVVDLAFGIAGIIAEKADIPEEELIDFLPNILSKIVVEDSVLLVHMLSKEAVPELHELYYDGPFAEELEILGLETVNSILTSGSVILSKEAGTALATTIVKEGVKYGLKNWLVDKKSKPTASATVSTNKMIATLESKKDIVDNLGNRITPEVQAEYAKDIYARAGVRLVYEILVSGSWLTSGSIRSIHEIEPDKVGSFFLEKFAKALSMGLYPVGPVAVDASITAIEYSFNQMDLNQTQKGFSLSTNGLSNALKLKGDTFFNSLSPLLRLEAGVETVPYVINSDLVEIGEPKNDFGGYNCGICVNGYYREPKTTITIKNNSNVGAYFDVVAVYLYQSYILFNTIPDVTYSETLVYSKYLSAGEDANFEIQYADSNSGSEPNWDSEVHFYILAKTKDGIFYQGHKYTIWNNSSVSAASSNSVQRYYLFPVSTHLIPDGNDVYTLHAVVRNPFEIATTFTITQPLTSQYTVEGVSHEGEAIGDSIIWKGAVLPGDTGIFTATLSIKTNVSESVSVPSGFVEFDEPSNPNPVVIATNSADTVVPYPFYVSIQSLNDERQLKLKVSNFLSRDILKDNVSIVIKNSSDEVLQTIGMEIELGKDESKLISLQLPKLLPREIKVEVHYRGLPDKLMTTEFLVQHESDSYNVLLPIVIR